MEAYTHALKYTVRILNNCHKYVYIDGFYAGGQWEFSTNSDIRLHGNGNSKQVRYSVNGLEIDTHNWKSPANMWNRGYSYLLRIGVTEVLRTASETY